MNNDCSNENHIAEILKVILMLQQNACPENCLDSCDRPALGGGVNCIVCNTRPISLYLRGCCGNQLLMPTTKDNNKFNETFEKPKEKLYIDIKKIN